jgi:hypothetical protein
VKTARRTRKVSKKDAPLMFVVAESIGSTLGTIAATADAAQKALTKSDVARKLGREGKKLLRTGKSAAQNIKRSKLARKGKRSFTRSRAKHTKGRRRSKS